MEMYKIIQSLNTFGGERLSPGFPTIRSMIQFMKHTYGVHKNYDYVLYTDEYGANLLSFMEEHIEIFDFIEIDDRIPYVGKFQVQEIQESPYIHVDLDAWMSEMPDESHDVLTEKLREPSFGVETTRIGVDTKAISHIVCSGIIGFSDIDFKNDYINKVYEKIEFINNEHNLGYKEFYTLEETLLTRMAIGQKKEIYVLPEGSFEHKYGNINKKI